MVTETDKSKPKVMLALPVFNEQKHLNAVLDEVGKYIGDILVVDDGSTDDSKLILARREDVCIISHPNNRGYGQSIIDAFHFAIGCAFEWVITMDCDLQHEPSQIPNFLAAIAEGDVDIVSGSRYLRECPANDQPPAERRQINKIITEKINEKLHLNLTDAFCGFKAYRVASVERLKLTETGYGLPLQFWVQCAAGQLRIHEIPVSLIYNDPNRHFGGELDEFNTRLEYYQKVWKNALQEAGIS
jgi:glycosyltransferase involved in cell wall biosynthesis